MRTGALLAVVIVSFAHAALAQAPAVANPPPQAPSCVAGRAAMDALATAIASQIGSVPAGVLVAAGPLASDVEAPKGDALSALLAQQVAGRLGASAKAQAAATLDAAREAARSAPGLVYLAPRIAAGKLEVTADGYPVPRTVWSMARAATPGPIAHAFAAAPLDAEVRTFLRPIPFAQPAVAKFDGADPDVLAIACGDVDGDGASDLYTVTRARVLQVLLRDGKVSRVREAAWSDLAPIAEAPLRQPIAAATVAAGHLDVGLTDRDGSVRLDAELHSIAQLPGLVVPAPAGSACAPLVAARIDGRRVTCLPGDPPAENAGMASDTVSATLLVAPDGGAHSLLGLRREDGAVLVREGAQDTVIGRAGAQLAIGDVDQDGALDIATTMDVLGRPFDALDVRTLLPTGTVSARYHLPVPTGVEALAMCPPDGDGRAPIVLASAGQIWVVR